MEIEKSLLGWIDLGRSYLSQMVKTLPAVQETWAQSLGWEDSLEKGTAATPVFLPRESHGRRAWQAVFCGVAKSD